MYSSILSLTSMLDGDRWLMPRPGPFTPGNNAVRIVLVAGWAPRAGLDGREEFRPPLGFDPRTVQPVACRFTDYAIPTHNIYAKQTVTNQH